MIKIFFISILFFTQLQCSTKTESYVSFEYWISEELKLFSLNDILLLKINEDKISVSANNWLGQLLLTKDLDYKNQNFSINNLFHVILHEKKIKEEDVWNNQYHLLDNKKIDVRYLYSNTANELRIYRMDIRTSNKDDNDNDINNVILKSNLIKIWTDLNKEIKKISITYGNSTYKIQLEDVK